MSLNDNFTTSISKILLTIIDIWKSTVMKNRICESTYNIKP